MDPLEIKKFFVNLTALSNKNEKLSICIVEDKNFLTQQLKKE